MPEFRWCENPPFYTSLKDRRGHSTLAAFAATRLTRDSSMPGSYLTQQQRTQGAASQQHTQPPHRRQHQEWSVTQRSRTQTRSMSSVGVGPVMLASAGRSRSSFVRGNTRRKPCRLRCSDMSSCMRHESVPWCREKLYTTAQVGRRTRIICDCSGVRQRRHMAQSPVQPSISPCTPLSSLPSAAVH